MPVARPGKARQQSCGNGDADAATELAHEVEHPRADRDQLCRQLAHRQVGERNENHAQTKPADDQRPVQGVGAALQGELGVQVHRIAVDEDADADEQPFIDLVFLGQLADHQGANGAGQGAGKDHHAALVGALLKQRLQQQRHHEQCAVQAEADTKGTDRAHEELAVAKQRHVDDRRGHALLPPEKRQQAEAAQQQAGDSQVRLQPVPVFATLKHDLQAADAQGEQGEADVVDALRAFLVD
ncbi:hypothetical protein D3C85_1050800 [compost metagenome]